MCLVIFYDFLNVFEYVIVVVIFHLKWSGGRFSPQASDVVDEREDT